jgi:nucleoid DNA-binding protein
MGSPSPKHSRLSISKRELWRFVNHKIKHLVHHYHVFAIISILFEEMIKDLKQGKSIRVANLGTISLKPTKPRWYHNVYLRKMVLSPGHRVMRFVLAPTVHKKLVEFLDLDKTLRDE